MQRARRHLGDQAQDMRSAKRPEADLHGRIRVGVSRIERRLATRYLDRMDTSEIMFLEEVPGFVWNSPPENNFIDALSSLNISDVHAEPQITTLDNQQAEIHVGELTPIRTIDAGGGAAAGGAFPVAQVQQQETGIILRATPHVTDGNQILLELEAERSSAELAESDAGFIFRTQRAQTRVLVRDGETVVIGGLTQSERNEVRTGIPLLMDIPYIGALFRVRRLQEVQQDLIILVTPHIIRSDVE